MLPGLKLALEAKACAVASATLKAGDKLCTVERLYHGRNGRSQEPVACSPCCTPEVLGFAQKQMVGRPVTRLFKSAESVAFVDGIIKCCTTDLDFEGGSDFLLFVVQFIFRLQRLADLNGCEFTWRRRLASSRK